MNGTEHAALHNLRTVERMITPDADIVSAAPGSPLECARLHALDSHRLYNTILAITKNPEDAEDALQDTFLRAHIALHTFEGRSNVHTWLTPIAINSALMILRRRPTWPEIMFFSQDDSGAETVFVDLRDPAPNPEEVYGLHQHQLKMLMQFASSILSCEDPSACK